MSSEHAKYTRILVIDDDPVVHKLLSAMLKKEGYTVLAARDGHQGLDIAQKHNPDLILLDVMMPDMNGYQVVSKLKDDLATKEIPVIFVSAKDESADRVMGLELGAADFIKKPFDRAELIVRVKTQLKLKRQEMELRDYSKNLEEMVAERTQMLIHADRLASLGTLSAGIAHEINNPTTFITGNLQILEQFWETLSSAIQRCGLNQDDRKVQYIIKEFPTMIQSIRSGADRITNIVAGLKTFSRKDSAEMGRTDLAECVEEALQLTNNRTKYHIVVKKEIPEGLPDVWANSQHLVQVFVNLIVNAADAISEKEGTINIKAKDKGNKTVEIRFQDNGAGISKEIKDKIFNPFFTTKPLGQGTGLGLSITHGIIQNHHGSIAIESEIGKGTCFVITLPTEHSDAKNVGAENKS